MTTSCDLLSAVEGHPGLPSHILRAAASLRQSACRILGPAAADTIDEASFRRAVLAGYPDRVAKRRAPRGDGLVLASGAGARQARESGVRNAQFLVAVDVAGAATSAGEALVRIATAIERDWISPTSREVSHELDPGTGTVRAAVVERYERLVLAEHPCVPDPGEAARLIAQAYLKRGLGEKDARLIRRMTFAGIDVDLGALVSLAAASAIRLDDVDLAAHLSPDVRGRLARDAPDTLKIPSGRVVRLDYRDEGTVVAAVRLQSVFGLAETPRVGARRVPVTFELLAPSGRPVQVTTDLGSFWTRGYPEVRKQLRARYPKHPWPEDPSTAKAT